MELDAEALGEVGGVAAAVFAGNGGGQGDTDDVFRAHRLGGEGADHRRVDSAAEAEEDPLESALAGVIAEAEYERLMNGRHPDGVVARRDGRSFGQGKIDDGVFGLEGGESREDAALGMMDDAATVKDEFVVSADRVAINDGAVAALRGSADEGLALPCLARLPGARGKIEEVIQICAGEGFEGIGGVVRFSGLVGLSPDILANGESDLESVP